MRDLTILELVLLTIMGFSFIIFIYSFIGIGLKLDLPMLYFTFYLSVILPYIPAAFFTIRYVKSVPDTRLYPEGG